MAEVKTKPTSVSVTAFLAGLPDETRRADAKTIIKIMQKVTGEKPKMWGPTIIGFGCHHYVYESGREGDARDDGRAAERGGGLVAHGATLLPDTLDKSTHTGVKQHIHRSQEPA